MLPKCVILRKPENQKFLWHFPKCRINLKLDCFDSLCAARLVENQKHNKFGHFGVDPTYSNHVDGASKPLGNNLPEKTSTIINR
jgi:hypothetical protein